MKFSFVKTIILITFSFQSITGQNPEKRCNGGDASTLKSDCVIIENSKLIFTEYNNEDAIFDKLSTVLRVENGVEVIGTTLENFDYLSNVEEIKNPDGPALLFRNNKDLKRITLENLKVLGGKKEDVIFDQDNFPVTAYDDPVALNDLLRLEAATRAFHGSEKCTEAFIKIIPFESPGYGWLLYVSICICAGITGFVAYQTIRLLKLKGKLGKKSGEKYVDDQEADGGRSKGKKCSKNLRLFGMKITVLVVPVCILFFVPSTVANLKVFTQECISKAEYSSCEIFNSCCHFRCSRARQKRSTCTINGTGINEIQTECICSKPVPQFEVPYTRKARHSRLDLIAGILFIFVLDMLLLSFTF